MYGQNDPAAGPQFFAAMAMVCGTRAQAAHCARSARADAARARARAPQLSTGEVVLREAYAKEIGTCHLHLDHEVELSHVCRVWERDYAACRLLQLARGSTEPWDHIRKDLLCHLLFGTTPMVLSDCSVAPPNLCCRCCFSRGEGCHSADVHRSRNATLTTFLPASGGNFMLR